MTGGNQSTSGKNKKIKKRARLNTDASGCVYIYI